VSPLAGHIAKQLPEGEMAAQPAPPTPPNANYYRYQEISRAPHSSPSAGEFVPLLDLLVELTPSSPASSPKRQ